MTAAADYVIVGGGVYGTAVGWELSKRGAGVLVLEAKPDVALGASGGTGLRGVRANGRSKAELPVVRRALELWPEVARELEPRAFDRRGGLYFIESPEDEAQATVWAQQQNGAGIDTRIVRGDELRDLEPHLSRSVTAALYSPNDGVSDHTATTRALAAAIARAGGAVRTRARVTRLHLEGQRVVGVGLDGNERIEVGTMALLFANAGINELLVPATGLSIPQGVVAPQVLVTAPLRERITTHLVGHVSRRFAGKMIDGDRFMITGGWLGAIDEKDGTGSATHGAIAGNLAEAIAMYPVLDGAAIEAAVADRLETVTARMLPIIDFVPGVPNLFVGSGWGGTGWAPALAYAELIAEWLVEGRRPHLLEPFGWET